MQSNESFATIIFNLPDLCHRGCLGVNRSPLAFSTGDFSPSGFRCSRPSVCTSRYREVLMAVYAYPQPRSDPAIVGVLIKLRAGDWLSTQMEAAHAVGLEGTKSRAPFSVWEAGMSIPRVACSAGLPDYSRGSPFACAGTRRASIRCGTRAMVGEWGWPAVSDNELQRLFPGRSGFQLKSPQPCRGSDCRASPVQPFRRMLIASWAWGNELDQLEAMLENSHWLALIGMPGVGKTWLAAHLAIRSHDPDIPFS